MVKKNAKKASSPFFSRDSQALETVQNFVKGLCHVLYEAAPQRLRLFTLVRGRIRGDLICMYKICDAVLLPPLALGFTVILSRFTNSGVRPVATSMRSALE